MAASRLLDLRVVESRSDTMEDRLCTLNAPLAGAVRKFSLVVLASRFEATRGLLWDGPQKFGEGVTGFDIIFIISQKMIAACTSPPQKMVYPLAPRPSE
ncbi:hypothetical protein AVEN_92357-1 [Araneus ventricosus]|uniref:Uncharacterized protein n=1 Tax=Araneus ventricosus TaxID=182803 RepID=A0A4Y2AH16_ARAVE|nr:hypothetical protein AVEN_92357-1 [Araneus ventricosus]